MVKSKPTSPPPTLQTLFWFASTHLIFKVLRQNHGLWVQILYSLDKILVLIVISHLLLTCLSDGIIGGIYIYIYIYILEPSNFNEWIWIICISSKKDTHTKLDSVTWAFLYMYYVFASHVPNSCKLHWESCSKYFAKIHWKNHVTNTLQNTLGESCNKYFTTYNTLGEPCSKHFAKYIGRIM